MLDKCQYCKRELSIRQSLQENLAIETTCNNPRCKLHGKTVNLWSYTNWELFERDWRMFFSPERPS